MSGEDLILWLFGPAGTRKSAIAKEITEIAKEEEGLLIAPSSPDHQRHERFKVISSQR